MPPLPPPTGLPNGFPGVPSAAALEAASKVGPAWSAFSLVANSFTDVVEKVLSHELRGKVVADATYRIVYRKPASARCETLAGVAKGRIVVWRGGERIKARANPKPGGAVATLNRSDPRATDTLGYGCGQNTPDAIATYWASHGSLTETSGPHFGNVGTDLITWTPEATFPIPIDREELILSKATHLPIETKAYKAGKLVEDSKFVSIKLDANVPNSAFDIRHAFP